MRLIKNSDKNGQNINQDHLARKIADCIIRTQFKVANYLNLKTGHFSKVQKEILLLAISALFTGVSLYLIFQAII